jgi:hypothetical protein
MCPLSFITLTLFGIIFGMYCVGFPFSSYDTKSAFIRLPFKSNFVYSQSQPLISPYISNGESFVKSLLTFIVAMPLLSVLRLSSPIGLFRAIFPLASVKRSFRSIDSQTGSRILLLSSGFPERLPSILPLRIFAL